MWNINKLRECEKRTKKTYLTQPPFSIKQINTSLKQIYDDRHTKLL